MLVMVGSIPLHGALEHTRASLFGFGVFLGAFLGAWLLLDGLVTSPPTIASASIALAASTTVLMGGQRILDGHWHSVPESLGLGAPVGRAVTVAALAGSAYFASLLLGAHLLGVSLDLRSNWLAILIASLIFHGLAEELAWRGFLFGRLRRSRGFTRAVLASMPFLALTHLPIIESSGIAVGGIAVVTAIITCVPLAYLWERGGRTVWAPALLHGLIGTWQLFERTYPVEFSMVIGAASISVPLLALLFRDRYSAASSEPSLQVGVAYGPRTVA
jgi:membrane protease YdiL (CAAX protease family)